MVEVDDDVLLPVSYYDEEAAFLLQHAIAYERWDARIDRLLGHCRDRDSSELSPEFGVCSAKFRSSKI